MTSTMQGGPALQHDVEQFLYQEAALLDERRYEAWLRRFTEDVRYRVPTRMNRLRKDVAKELAGPDEVAHMDDDLQGLRTRVARLLSGKAWSETPPSRTRRIVGNVRLRLVEGEDAVEARSNLLVYRSRLEHTVDVFAGERHDLLRRTGDGFAIARRTVYLDQTIMLSSNMSIFF